MNDILILCGGKGNRLKSIINNIPKPMVRINNKPFLDILITQYKKLGFDRFILCVGYKKEIIKKYYSDKKENIIFSEEDVLLGTGGAIKNAEDKILSDNFIVINGDTFSSINLKKILKYHIDNKSIATIVLKRNKDKLDYGNVIIDKKNRIISFNEKMISTDSYINCGIYFLNKSIFKYFPKGNIFSLERDIFPNLIVKKYFGYITNTKFYDIGTPEKLKYFK